jgi:hypothetical protein
MQERKVGVNQYDIICNGSTYTTLLKSTLDTNNLNEYKHRPHSAAYVSNYRSYWSKFMDLGVLSISRTRANSAKPLSVLDSAPPTYPKFVKISLATKKKVFFVDQCY